MVKEAELRRCAPKDLKKARAIGHKIAQFVTKAARANLKAEPDDSHSNIGWNDALKGLMSQPIANEGAIIFVGASIAPLSIGLFRDDQIISAQSLEDVKESDAASWLDAELQKEGLKTCLQRRVALRATRIRPRRSRDFPLAMRARRAPHCRHGMTLLIPCSRNLQRPMRIWFRGPALYAAGLIISTSQPMSVWSMAISKRLRALASACRRVTRAMISPISISIRFRIWRRRHCRSPLRRGIGIRKDMSARSPRLRRFFPYPIVAKRLPDLLPTPFPSAGKSSEPKDKYSQRVVIPARQLCGSNPPHSQAIHFPPIRHIDRGGRG